MKSPPFNARYVQASNGINRFEPRTPTAYPGPLARLLIYALAIYGAVHLIGDVILPLARHLLVLLANLE